MMTQNNDKRLENALLARIANCNKNIYQEIFKEIFRLPLNSYGAVYNLKVLYSG
jgi:hypothetical protein